MASPLAPFVPPHCPRSDCRFHRSADGWRWTRHGCFTRDCAPHRIPRFRCAHCGHTFSSQTFATTYWLKRPDVFLAAAFRLLACSGYRQIAREARCAHTTVMRHASRLGRHALLFLHEHRRRGPITEATVGDGFESFAYSQFSPCHLNLNLGSPSNFCYAFTHSELRRKGRMTPGQRRRRAELERMFGRPDPKAIERGMALSLELAMPEPQAVTWRTDEHPAYLRVRRHLPRHTIRHERTPGVAARTAGNPLFPANRLDSSLRHNSANHKRQTIAFSKRHQSVVERCAWLIAWQNYTKPFSERRGGGTPAMRIGLKDRPIPIREILKQRLFPERVQLPAEWARYYRGEVVTRYLKNERRHRLKLAV